MSMILAWVLFPLVLAALGAGWGAVVERAAGSPVSGVLLVPLGLAAVIVAMSLLTEWSFTAPATTAVVAVVALAGLLASWRARRISPGPVIAAIAVLLAYGAPVLLSGSATFTGYFRLDDTATWLDVVDHAMTHLHSTDSTMASTYSLVFTGDVGPSYPLGSFMLLIVGHALTGVDAAWVLQPYLACCGAAVGLAAYALLQPLAASQPVRALLAFLAAQPALLYGYSLWGGIKELTAAFLLILGAALLAQVIVKRPDNPRGLLPVAVAASALILTLGVGAAAFVVPALIVLVIVWVRAAWPGELNALARDLGLLSAVTAVLTLPIWIRLSSFLSGDAGLFSAGQPIAQRLGLLVQPLSGWQLAGIWPVGDFRSRAPTLASAPLIGLAVIAAAGAIWMTLRRRQFALTLYVAIALAGCGIFYLLGTTPWVVAKILAISSPALLVAALSCGVLLRLRQPAGILLLLAIGGSVVWSNVLAYHDATLAPRPRLAELQHIGDLVAGKGPTLINEYEWYADRHFLRDGAPVEPAEYRPYTVPLRDGVQLTKSASADLDAFAASTLEAYRSIVTRRSPAESRPPSIYRLVWQGRYYQLWQRPVRPSTRILQHVPLGESNTLPYCGMAQNASPEPLCSIDPVATPPCAQVQGLARQASAEHAGLVAYQRPAPIVARGDETVWPGRWTHNLGPRSLIATTPGEAVGHIVVPSAQRYELWLGGSFARGFGVSVDGRSVGRVKDELSDFSGYVHLADFGGYVHLADLFLAPGVHTFVLTYPHADLTPGSGNNDLTSLTAIALQPQSPPSELIAVDPRQATRLCGRPLDWIEVARRITP